MSRPTHRIHLATDQVSLLLDVTEAHVPTIVHWGASLGDLSAADADAIAVDAVEFSPESAPDLTLKPSILPQQADGWDGNPGIMGYRDGGGDFSPQFTVTGVYLVEHEHDAARAAGATAPVPSDASDGGRELDAFTQTGPALVRFDLADDTAQLKAVLEVEMLPSGLVRMRMRLANTGTSLYNLHALTLTYPLPMEATQILDFAGRWGKERSPQTRDITVGTHLRENRKGRTGADSTYVLHAGTEDFGFQRGEIWALHVAWSGNHRAYVEKLSSGHQVLGGGELLMPGEGRLQEGEEYTTPWLYGAYGMGLDTIAHQFHRYLRSRPQHVDTARPVTLNVWEAVYFDHNFERLRNLADRAAALGVERYVLDDGWFGSRRDDRSGLGDWYVSKDMWPDGLGPLVDHVTGLGMQFGLWFEPEMINEDSDLARLHPEWIMATGDRLPIQRRHQQVLNLSIPAAYEHIRDRMVDLLTEYNISYIKWDHNRDLIDAGTQPVGQAAIHEQTLATYRLFDELQARFPHLEIESCSSGGARIDLGIMERSDRVWVSDCIDPLERQHMNRWTAQLLPLELMGSHIASGESHTTGRLHPIAFRCATALFGHLGIEWDLAQATEDEMAALREWIAYYKRHRDLICSGELVRADRGEDSMWVSGVVDRDASRALFSIASVARSSVTPRGRIRLPGLDASRRYRVRPRVIGSMPVGFALPRWARPTADGCGYDGITLPGQVLATCGLQAPLMSPDSVLLLEVDTDPAESDAAGARRRGAPTHRAELT
ncbi:alpha-galactosidase [Devriesea agamarum]|uniref:alpha-galactosidase n=1 Tax=Devriesea agamarum TaxID=472569 RepID=UPI00071E47B5|nr:alpha-galactosidase [Devriesea agamarum]